MRQIFLLFFTALAVSAQPRITAVGNGSDLSAALAPGSLAVVVGTQLAEAAASASAPLPTTLGDVSVSIGGQAAPLSYVSPTQILFQVPYGIPVGTTGVKVTAGSGTSETVEIPVTATAPGIYFYGPNRGLIQNQDLTLNGTGSAAPAGSTVTVYLTGIGRTNPAVADGTLAPRGTPAVPIAKATATIGGEVAQIQFIGLTPGEVGLAQANLLIPNVATGDLPLVVSMNGVASRAVQIAVVGTSAPSPSSGAAPEERNCVSGPVDSVVFSLQNKLAGLADEIVVKGTRLCEKCDVKPPVFVEFVKMFELSREDGTTVDACYDSDGRVNAVQLRR